MLSFLSDPFFGGQGVEGRETSHFLNSGSARTGNAIKEVFIDCKLFNFTGQVMTDQGEAG